MFEGKPGELVFIAVDIAVDFSQRKRNCFPANRASAPFNVAKACNIFKI